MAGTNGLTAAMSDDFFDDPQDNFADAMQIEAAAVAVDPADEDRATVCRYVAMRQRYQLERERIIENLERLKAQMDKRLAWVEEVLAPPAEAATRRLLETQKGKTKSVVTPWGRCGFRTVKPKLVVDDPERALAAVPSAAKPQPPKLDKAALDAHFIKTGEEIPGTHLEPGGEKLTVTAK
jgi:hypothetical protein